MNWFDFYITNGPDNFRVYVRPWKQGDAPSHSDKWNYTVQPLKPNGVVRAEKPLFQEWAPKDLVVENVLKTLGSEFRVRKKIVKPCTSAKPSRRHSGFDKFL